MIAYLRDPKNIRQQEILKTKPHRSTARRQRKPTPEFTGAKFGIEIGGIQMMPSGQFKLILYIPAEDREEAFKLSSTPGLLLEASVSAVEGRIK